MKVLVVRSNGQTWLFKGPTVPKSRIIRIIPSDCRQDILATLSLCEGTVIPEGKEFYSWKVKVSFKWIEVN